MGRREFLKVAAITAVSSGMAFWAGRRSRFAGGCYVQLGTSITSGAGTKLGGMIPTFVADKLGMLGINGGCPGSCAGDHKFPEMNTVSLFSLSNAIVSGDWSAQSKRTGNLLRDVAISRLMTAGFETVSHIGLEYGPNDFRYDSPIGSDSETCRETFKGALNYSIRTLLAGYPKIRIFLITPWWMPTFDDRDSDQYPNGACFFLREYVDAMLQVADLNRIPCLDLWSTSGVSKFNYREFTIDGVHLNDAGVIRRADMIASFMRSVY